MNYKQRITADYRIMLGKPIIKSTRITVELLLRKLAIGYSVVEIIGMYPHIEMKAILAAKCYNLKNDELSTI